MMGAAFDLRRVNLASPTRRDLDELQTARDALVKDRTAALNRKKHARHKLLKRQLRNRLAQIDRQIKALDAEVAKLIAGDKVLTRKAEVLTSVPGIGAVTAAGLLSKMPELGTIDRKAAASLAGLAPMTRESGTWKGRSFIHGGRARPRRLLYMASVSAIRHNPDFVRKYRELRERGKPPKVALTAIMRKMLVLANALLGHDRLRSARHSQSAERRPPTPGNSRGYQPQLPATSPKHQPKRRAKVRRNTIFATWILLGLNLERGTRS